MFFYLIANYDTIVYLCFSIINIIIAIKGDSMNFKRNNLRKMFLIYIGLMSNVNMDLQTEQRLLSYRQFSRVKNKKRLFDLCRKILYNS